MMLKELTIMRSLNHKNIISLIDVYETNEDIVFIMEYVSGGDIANLSLIFGVYQEEKIAKIM